MKNDFREFYDDEYLMHRMSDDELMHWEWPSGIRKYIDKIRTASGKWRYIYENDVKPGVKKAVNKGKQILQEDAEFYKDAIDKAKKHKQFKKFKKNTQSSNPVDRRKRSHVTAGLSNAQNANPRLHGPNVGLAKQKLRAQQQQEELAAAREASRRRVEKNLAMAKAKKAQKQKVQDTVSSLTSKVYGNKPKVGSVPYTGDTSTVAARRAAEEESRRRRRWEARNKGIRGHRG